MTMEDSPDYYLATDVRELDRLAIEEYGIPGFTLMGRAGQGAFNALLARWPDTRHVLCFCGSGNNGGDGYVIAALAAKKGLAATVVAVGTIDALKGDARLAWEMARGQGVQILPLKEIGYEEPDTHEGTVIVDAMLGTGLSGNVRGDYLQAIRMINSSGCPILSADIPSGLCSDTGAILGEAVRADVTVTFIGRKLGQISGDGPGLCGNLVFDDLDVPPDIYTRVRPAAP